MSPSSSRGSPVSSSSFSAPSLSLSSESSDSTSSASISSGSRLQQSSTRSTSSSSLRSLLSLICYLSKDQLMVRDRPQGSLLLTLGSRLFSRLLATDHLTTTTGILADRLTGHSLAGHHRLLTIFDSGYRGGGNNFATPLLATSTLDFVGILAFGDHALAPIDVGRGIWCRVVTDKDFLLA